MVPPSFFFLHIYRGELDNIFDFQSLHPAHPVDNPLDLDAQTDKGQYQSPRVVMPRREHEINLLAFFF
jgi:hypothetical protein